MRENVEIGRLGLVHCLVQFFLEICTLSKDTRMNFKILLKCSLHICKGNTEDTQGNDQNPSFWGGNMSPESWFGDVFCYLVKNIFLIRV